VTIGYPAEQANMTGYIIGIDGYAINTTDDLARVLTLIGPDREVVVTTVNGTEQLAFRLTTAPDPSYNASSSGPAQQRGYLGIGYVSNVNGLKPELAPYSEAIGFFGGLFFWLYLLNLGVGAFNLLPMKPLDGERMWRLVARRFVKSDKSASRVMNYVSMAILFIILAFFALVLV
jgi:membrane-associated protease RseP (regulator of RpoE activity)